MTLQQLSFFVAIHRCGNFTAAADELYISQSSISKSIIALEKELGADLFVRTTRRIRLSELGLRLLPYAMRMVQEYEGLLAYTAQTQRTCNHLIHVGGVPVLSIYGLTEVIMQFETRHPEFSVDICEIKTADILSQITGRSLDVGVVQLSLPLAQKPQDLTVVPLIDDHQVLLVPKTDPLADAGTVSLEQMRGRTFVQLNSDPLIAAYHVDWLKAALPDAPVYLANTQMDTIKQYVLQRGWSTLVMDKVAQYAFEPDVCSLTLSQPLCLTLCAVLRKDISNYAAWELVRFLRAQLSGKTHFSQLSAHR